MGIKRIYQAIIPESFRSRLSMLRSALKQSGRANRLKKYYQDRLSVKYLHDREWFMITHDKSVFVRRIKKRGGHVDLSDSLPSCERLVVVYDKFGSSRYRMTVSLLAISGWKNRYRRVKADETMLDSISENEVVIPALSMENYLKYSKLFQARGIKVIDFPHGYECGFMYRYADQYMDVYDPVPGEVVIDSGSFDASTAVSFLKWGGVAIDEIYTLEACPDNFDQCELTIAEAGTDRIKLIKRGTWSERTELKLSDNDTDTAGAMISDVGTVDILVDSIDNMMGDKKVTFIKMDVEGAELESLKGAKKTILRDHPRLAICIYHKPSDIYEIPEYILSLDSRYRFYVRHYSTNEYETVLYANIP